MLRDRAGAGSPTLPFKEPCGPTIGASKAQAQMLDTASDSSIFGLMTEIPPPTVDENDSDRFISCQDALHAEFQDLVKRAVVAGWKAEEVLVAMIELADNQALMMEANAEVEAALKVLKRKGFL